MAVPDDEVNDILRVKPTAVYANLGRQNQARAQRKLGRSNETILIGNFIAFTPNYLPNVSEQKRQEFWLVKVVEVYAKDKEEKVRIRLFNTTVAKNASAGKAAKWTIWIGPKDYEPYDWVTSDRIIIQIPALTSTGLVTARGRERIMNMLRLLALEKAEAANAKQALESVGREDDNEGDEGDEGDEEGDDE